MKKKYMDFVPARSAKTTKRPTPRPKKATPPASTTHKTAIISNTATLGVIENLSPKVTTPVTATSHFVAKPSNLKAAKAAKSNRKPAAKITPKAPEKQVYKTPKTQFINQDKVVKRPLSKNVYHKKIDPAKETAKKPVTIITKPEKGTKVGLIITIIITIILGAAAGTVAFLLLPK